MSFLERLADVVRGKAVPVPMPDWARITLAEEVEEIIEAKARDQSSSWAGYIRYVDTKGDVSERRIVCRAIEGYGRAETVQGWCCERRAPRRFRIDRMQELVCLETGEVLDPLGHFEQLRMFGALKVTDKSMADFGRVLAFMARCDGEVHPMESQSIETALERYVVRFGGDDRMLETAVTNVRKITPDGDDFIASLGRLEQHPDARQLGRLLLDCVAKVTDADGRLHAREIEWIEVVQETLKAMAGH